MTGSRFQAQSKAQRGSAQQRELAQQSALRITDRQEFGDFCQKLIESEVRFTLGGFQTVFLSKNTLENLPEEPRELLSRLERSHLVRKCAAPAERRRHIRTQSEVDQILRKFADERRRH